MKDITEFDFNKEIKDMSFEEMDELADEIRRFLIDHVSKTGGHLASNLGIVELTLAIHRVFDCYKDRIIWDVGHQSYVHKILTGRAGGFDELRTIDGISGFPKTNESDADVFDTGHASNSISLASGLVKARDLNGDDYDIVTVIGDGSLTGGMAYEGLNNLGVMHSRAIVILNDNGLSISKNEGAVAGHLGRLRLTSSYMNAKSNVKNALNRVPVVGPSVARGLSNLKNTVKYAVVEGAAMFESLGFQYAGPVDGHDIPALVEILEHAKEYDHPVLVHAVTVKGKGYGHAENDPGRFHGIGSFDKETGESLNCRQSYSDVFGRKLADMALKDEDICAVYAAMKDGTGLDVFADLFPDRSFDVGIAEEHAVSFAAGLAKGGKKPVVAVYSTFLQRAYDQILEDVCLQGLHVVFAIDRAGVVGADGETHHGVFDLSYLSSMPGITILTPSDFAELESMLEFAMSLDGPVAVRYPRGAEEMTTEHDEIVPGKAKRLHPGKDVTLFAFGNMTAKALKVRELLAEKGIDASVIDGRFVTPLDTEMLDEEYGITGSIVTLEDNVHAGGAGEKINSHIDRSHVLNISWPDEFICHGSVGSLEKKYGLTAEDICERIVDWLGKEQ